MSLIQEVEDDLGADQSGKQIDPDSETQGHGKSFDRPRAEEEQRHPRDQGGHVRVDNRQQRLVISSIYRQANRFP